MPRVRTSTSDPVDFCGRCFPTENEARRDFGDQGDGPDGRGNCFAYDDDHPDYSGEDYHCHRCGVELTDDDNQPL